MHEHLWMRQGSAVGTNSEVVWGPWHCVVCGVVMEEDAPEQGSAQP